jgi:RNA polymerase sigma-70 factor (ECF subfamily)
MHTTPITLLERLRQAPDEAAWERLLQLYVPLLFAWARRAGESDHDASDLVQDVLTILVQTLPTFQHDARKSFRCWLRTVTLNALRDRKRRLAAAGRVSLEAVPEPALPDDAERFWEDDYRKHLLGRALKVMQGDFEPTTWQACWQFVAEGRSAAEVAAALGISENAVYLARCR